MGARILVVDDDAGIVSVLKVALANAGYEVAAAASGDEGLAQAKTERFDLVVSDWRLPGLSGLELVEQLGPAKPGLPIILMTGHGTASVAIEARKRGVWDFVLKPFAIADLLARIAKALASARARGPKLEAAGADLTEPEMVGSSAPMQALYAQIGLAARAAGNVLIRGETGSGKELVARAIHRHSTPREPFVAVNCSAFADTLLESELFGHERGAFTGAHQRRIGRFEQAGHGTLFLDEIGEINPRVQVKLLRVLEQRAFERVGGSSLLPVHARIIAATNRDLEAAIAGREFRPDLFFRLNGQIIHVPPLRQRLQDLPELVRWLLRRLGLELRLEHPSIETGALALLAQHPWPGNLRELENVLRQALLLARAGCIAGNDVRQALSH